MEQPWNQQRGGGSGFAMEESSCHAAVLDQAMTMTTTDRCEVDGALLMELMIMEDLPSSSDFLLDGDDVDRQQLSRVIRSLEAEIGGAGDDLQASAAMMADEGTGEGLDRIEDVLSDDDMDGYDYDYEGASSLFLAAGHDDQAEGWCVYTNGYESGSVLGYDTMVDHQYYYCSTEGSAEHMYLPLWE